MPTLKEQIKEKIELLSEHEFQQLANDFARLYSPETFKGLNELSGMNLKGFTIPGQPDSYSIYKNGLATVQASKNDDWSGKSKKDIDLMVTSLKNRINYICFIFKLMDVKPTDKKINEIKDYAFEKLGVSQEMVDFLFGGSLISELSQPKYSGILYKNLGITLNRKPFKTLKEKIQSFSIEFYPKLDDFEKSIVFLPKERAINAKSSLDDRRHDLGVLGLGSSGKTMFVLTLGFDYYNNGYEVLYFDFESSCDDRTADEIYDFILKNHHQNLFLILDNVHLYEKMYPLFKKIRDLQLELGNNTFKIIYVGRKIWPKDEEKNFLKKFILNEHGYVINLGAPNEKERYSSLDSESFYNVFKYFTIKNRESFWNPPKSQLDKWCVIFGNDLFIFSYALYEYARKGRKLRTFNASRKLVHEKIGSEYLKEYKSKDDLNNFIDLCSLGTLDLLVPFSFFNPTHDYEEIFNYGIKKGIIVELLVKQERYYSIIYPSLAKSIITVFFKNKEKELNHLIFCLKRIPKLASTAFGNLHIYYGKDLEYIFKGLFSDDEYLKNIISSGYLLPIEFIKISQKYIPKLNERVQNIIDSNLEVYSYSLASKGIGFTLSHLRYSNNYPNRLLKILLEFYKKCYPEILNGCYETQSHMISSFIGYLEELQLKHKLDSKDKELLNQFENKLLDDLTNPKNQNGLYSKFFDEKMDLGHCTSLLNFVKNKRPSFFQQVLKDLSKDKSRLTKRTFDTFVKGYQHFISLLNFLDENKLSSVIVMEDMFKKYGHQFKGEYTKKGEQGQKIFTEFFNKKYKEYPEIIQQFNSLTT